MVNGHLNCSDRCYTELHINCVLYCKGRKFLFCFRFIDNSLLQSAPALVYEDEHKKCTKLWVKHKQISENWKKNLKKYKKHDNGWPFASALYVSHNYYVTTTHIGHWWPHYNWVIGQRVKTKRKNCIFLCKCFPLVFVAQLHNQQFLLFHLFFIENTISEGGEGEMGKQKAHQGINCYFIFNSSCNMQLYTDPSEQWRRILTHTVYNVLRPHEHLHRVASINDERNIARVIGWNDHNRRWFHSWELGTCLRFFRFSLKNENIVSDVFMN